jgi:hypothetical protein
MRMMTIDSLSVSRSRLSSFCTLIVREGGAGVKTVNSFCLPGLIFSSLVN